MATLIKLTDPDGYTRRGQPNEARWAAGCTRAVDGSGDLCGPGFIHAYEDLYIALLLNPAHAGIADPLPWRAEGVIAARDCGLQVGCTSLTTIEVIARPEITAAQRVTFGILCARQAYADPAWCRWSDAWLSGSNRTAAPAAYAAARAAKAARGAEAVGAAWGAEAAEAAAWEAGAAARAATWAADAAWAAAEEAAWAVDAVDVTKVAAAAAWAAVDAVKAAARAGAPFDLLTIARQAVGIR